MRTHEYLPDPSAIDRPGGEPRCLCGMPKRNRVHEVPERSEEEKEIAARMLGESDG